jgi:hypothetical protein
MINKLKLKVHKRVLFFFAAFVWGFAAYRILLIGVGDVLKNTEFYWINIIIGIIGVYFFFKGVFYKMYKKHTRRIINSESEKLFIISFFDVRGYIIMIFMITLGVTLRKLNVIPSLYIGTFYITLGGSLLSASLSFLYAALKYDRVKEKYFNRTLEA